MRLDLDRTPAGRSHVPVDGACTLDFGPEGPDKVQLSGELLVDNLESRCVLRGNLEATGEATCGRCLERFELKFAVSVKLVVLRDADQESEDTVTLVLHQRDGLVDLTEAVREATVLAVPHSRICREDCRGLCVQCGANLNEGACECEDDDVDPRWDGLPG